MIPPLCNYGDSIDLPSTPTRSTKHDFDAARWHIAKCTHYYKTTKRKTLVGDDWGIFVMKRYMLHFYGFASGASWFLVALFFGAQDMFHTSVVNIALASLGTGVAITHLSQYIYLKTSARALWWYSPLSVYVATALFAVTTVCTMLLTGQIEIQSFLWEKHLTQNLFAMWYACTIFVPYALLIHTLAFINHHWLRTKIVARDR